MLAKYWKKNSKLSPVSSVACNVIDIVVLASRANFDTAALIAASHSTSKDFPMPHSHFPHVFRMHQLNFVASMSLIPTSAKGGVRMCLVQNFPLKIRSSPAAHY